MFWRTRMLQKKCICSNVCSVCNVSLTLIISIETYKEVLMILMIRVKLTLQTLQTLLHTNPSHQDEPFQSEKMYVSALTLCDLKQAYSA